MWCVVGGVVMWCMVWCIALLALHDSQCVTCFPLPCLHCLLHLAVLALICSRGSSLTGEQWCPLPALASIHHSLPITSWLSSLRLHLLNRSPTACFGRAAMSLHEDARMNVAEKQGGGSMDVCANATKGVVSFMVTGHECMLIPRAIQATSGEF